MPAKKRPKPLYQRGKYRLYERQGRNLEIVWYDDERKRERGISAGTTDAGQGELALDRIYLENGGDQCCPTCHRPWDASQKTLALTAIADYLVRASEQKGFSDSTSVRLSHVTRYIAETDPAVLSIQIDEAWIERFRKWRGKESWRGKPISLSHIEGSVMQFAAAINASLPEGQSPQFKARPMNTVSRTPTYRADIATLASMFRYALAAPHRDTLLRFIRASVATWARPDAVYDIHPRQWTGQARVLALNPEGRVQTKKHRPTIPVARQFAVHLESLDGPYIKVASIRSSWDKMRKELGLPPGVDGGTKLIRRSIATIARKRLGEADWIQGRMMLGHVKTTTSDIYALPDPAHFGKVLAVTEEIITEIEAIEPAAYRNLTALNFCENSKTG